MFSELGLKLWQMLSAQVKPDVIVKLSMSSGSYCWLFLIVWIRFYVSCMLPRFILVFEQPCIANLMYCILPVRQVEHIIITGCSFWCEHIWILLVCRAHFNLSGAWLSTFQSFSWIEHISIFLHRRAHFQSCRANNFQFHRLPIWIHFMLTNSLTHCALFDWEMICQETIYRAAPTV